MNQNSLIELKIEIGFYVNMSASTVLLVNKGSNGSLVLSSIVKLLPEGNAGNLFEISGSNVGIKTKESDIR